MANTPVIQPLNIVETQFKVNFADTVVSYSPYARWNEGYKMLEIIWQTFDSFPEYFDFDLNELRQLHQNNLPISEKEKIFSGIDLARFEYYVSLNEAGELALLLAENATFTGEQLQQAYHHYVQVGLNNFIDEDLENWARMNFNNI